MKKLIYLTIYILMLNTNFVICMKNDKSQEKVTVSNIQTLFSMATAIIAKQMLGEQSGKCLSEILDRYISDAVSKDLCNLDKKMIQLKNYKELLKQFLGNDASILSLIDKYLKQNYIVEIFEVEMIDPYSFEAKYSRKLMTPLLLAKAKNEKAAKIIREILDEEIEQNLSNETKNNNKTWLKQFYEKMLLSHFSNL